MSTYQVKSEIDIAATPERIWSILTDFSAYPDWNPFIRSISGTPDLGSSLVVRIQPSGTKGMTFRPTVLASVRGQELRWLGRFLVAGLFDGEHQFSIHPIAEGKIRFRQSERFSGILVSVFKGTLNREIGRAHV
jgi:hypothetical protein